MHVVPIVEQSAPSLQVIDQARLVEGGQILGEQGLAALLEILPASVRPRSQAAQQPGGQRPLGRLHPHAESRHHPGDESHGHCRGCGPLGFGRTEGLGTGRT